MAHINDIVVVLVYIVVVLSSKLCNVECETEIFAQCRSVASLCI